MSDLPGLISPGIRLLRGFSAQMARQESQIILSQINFSVIYVVAREVFPSH